MGNENKSEPLKRVKGKKCSVQVGKTGRAARYNNKKVLGITVIAMEGFAMRLTALRMERGISAREMSLSLGMTANYINGIESGDSFPSMAMFFEICEYLKVSPKEFFAYTELKPVQSEELKRHVDRLDAEELALVLQLVKKIEK